MHIILIGNYPPDKQESMERFTQMLANGWNSANISTDIWRPTVVFGRSAKTTYGGIGKWLGYVDKWLLFPMVLRWRSMKKKSRNNNTTFHICDHSNAPYLSHLPIDRTAITCHDVLAIRGAFGHADAYCTASRTGLILQKWILRNLGKANKLAAVSHLTFNQLSELTKAKGNKVNWRIIHNAFNDDFEKMDAIKAHELLSRKNIDIPLPFILHVGSGLPRKNRRLLIDMLVALGDAWHGNILFAGHAMDAELKQHADQSGVSDRIIEIIKPDHQTLLALYSTCAAFIFPSFSEGFGWPLIEAQACGAPVIASNIAPMPEVSNGSAMHEDPHDSAAFARAFISLQDEAKRRQLIEVGYENIKRFQPKKMIAAYLDLHRAV